MDEARGEGRLKGEEVVAEQPFLPALPPIQPDGEEPRIKRPVSEIVKLQELLTSGGEISRKIFETLATLSRESQSIISIEPDLEVKCTTEEEFEALLAQSEHELEESKAQQAALLEQFNSQFQAICAIAPSGIESLSQLYPMASELIGTYQRAVEQETRNDMAFARLQSAQRSYSLVEAESLGVQAEYVYSELDEVSRQIRRMKKRYLGLGRYTHNKDIEPLKDRARSLDKLYKTRALGRARNLTVPHTNRSRSQSREMSKAIQDSILKCYQAEIDRFQTDRDDPILALISIKRQSMIAQSLYDIANPDGQAYRLDIGHVALEHIGELDGELSQTMNSVNLGHWTEIRTEAEAGGKTKGQLDEVEFVLIDKFLTEMGSKLNRDNSHRAIKEMQGAASDEAVALKSAIQYYVGDSMYREQHLKEFLDALPSDRAIDMPGFAKVTDYAQGHSGFCAENIANPEIKTLEVLMLKDDVFLAELVSAAHYTPMNKIIITEDPLPDGILYDDDQKIEFLNPDRVKGLLPDEEAACGEYSWDSDLNQRLLRAQALRHARNCTIQEEFDTRFDDGESVAFHREGHFDENEKYVTTREIIKVSMSFYWEIAEKYGYNRKNLPALVPNPENHEFDILMRELVSGLLERDDQPDLQLAVAHSIGRFMQKPEELAYLLDYLPRIEFPPLKSALADAILNQITMSSKSADYLMENAEKAGTIVYDRLSALSLCQKVAGSLNTKGEYSSKCISYFADLIQTEPSFLEHTFKIIKKIQGNVGFEELLKLTEEAEPGYAEASEEYVEMIAGVDGYYHNGLILPAFKFLMRHPNDVDFLYQLVTHPSVSKDGLVIGHLIDHLSAVVELPDEKKEEFLDLFIKIAFSPSQEIQRMRVQLLEQIMTSPDPMASYQRIEEIFIRNNLPTVGKVIKVFEVLYSKETVQRMLAENESLSPILRKALTVDARFPDRSEMIRDIFYSDLLNIHINSGNRSLREYLEMLRDGQAAIDILDSHEALDLDDHDQKLVRHFLAMARTLNNAQSGDQVISMEGRDEEFDLREEYSKVRDSLGVAEGESIKDRLEELFLKPSGCENFEQVLTKMSDAKLRADKRNRLAIEQRDLNLPAGSIVKGIIPGFFEIIMQNGSVAREFLGAGSGSDMTPFDTDTARIDDNLGLMAAYNQSYANSFGGLALVVRDRGQFDLTSSGGEPKYNRDKYEIFYSGVVGSKHFGVRTGFASTEVDFIIADEGKGNLDDIFYTIARNGYYLPVVSTSGEVLFTPEIFDELRKTFAGIDKFEGSAYSWEKVESPEYIAESISATRSESARNREEVRSISLGIRNIILEALREHNVELKDEMDRGLFGAELHDTGSTGRGTNMPENYDFDFVLRLDNDEKHQDLAKVGDITAAIMNRVGAKEESKSHADDNGGYQLRLKDVQVGDIKIDLDIAFVPKAEVQIYASHQAVSDRLSWIRENISEEAYEDTIANIVLAKKLLKDGGAYKKVGDGGMGGIGVENWILLNHGNIESAFRSFWEAAHNDRGDIIDFAQFQAKYRIMDPGINAKFNRNDDFIKVLKGEGYYKMLEVIEDYLHLN